MEINITWTICRICMAQERNPHEFVPIYEDPRLPIDIFECSGIEISLADNLPEKICKKCLQILKFAIKFRALCQETTEQLKARLLTTINASKGFKPKNPDDDNISFENVDFLEEDHSIGTELCELVSEDVDEEETEFISRNSDTSEMQEGDTSEKIVLSDDENGVVLKDEYIDEDIKRELEEDIGEYVEVACESADQFQHYVINNENLPKPSDDETTMDSRKDAEPKSNVKNNDHYKPLYEFVCDLCGNHFQKKAILTSHMRIHRNEKNYICEICSKRFNSPCNLRAHIRIHTGEKPFVCKFCERKFADRSTQIKHERIHTNEKPYICLTCGKKFSLSTSLKAHEKIHSGERPYKCEPCSKAFTLPHQLKAHLATNMHRLCVDNDPSIKLDEN